MPRTFEPRYDDLSYFSDFTKNLSGAGLKQMRAEYSRIRSAMNKRIDRVNDSDLAYMFQSSYYGRKYSDGFPSLRAVSDAEFPYILQDLYTFSQHKTTLGDLREARQRSIEGFKKKHPEYVEDMTDEEIAQFFTYIGDLKAEVEDFKYDLGEELSIFKSGRQKDRTDKERKEAIKASFNRALQRDAEAQQAAKDAKNQERYHEFKQSQKKAGKPNARKHRAPKKAKAPKRKKRW